MFVELVLIAHISSPCSQSLLFQIIFLDQSYKVEISINRKHFYVLDTKVGQSRSGIFMKHLLIW